MTIRRLINTQHAAAALKEAQQMESTIKITTFGESEAAGGGPTEQVFRVAAPPGGPPPHLH